MVVVPASTAACAGIAIGLSKDLLQRAAEVNLKERRPVVVVPRETPVTRSHLEHLLALHDAGAVVLPASPGLLRRRRAGDGRSSSSTSSPARCSTRSACRTRSSAGGPASSPSQPTGANVHATSSVTAGAYRRARVRPMARRARSVARRTAALVVQVVELAFALEQCAYLRLAEAAMAARRADAADPSRGRPPRHGLRVDAEQRSHLARRQQTISSVHSPLPCVDDASRSGRCPRCGRERLS